MNTVASATLPDDSGNPRPRFTLKFLRANPLRGTGIGLVLLLRLLFGIFFLGGAVNKFQRNYMFGDYPLDLFTKRLTEIDPASFPAMYLEKFIIDRLGGHLGRAGRGSGHAARPVHADGRPDRHLPDGQFLARWLPRRITDSVEPDCADLRRVADRALAGT